MHQITKCIANIKELFSYFDSEPVTLNFKLTLIELRQMLPNVQVLQRLFNSKVVIRT